MALVTDGYNLFNFTTFFTGYYGIHAGTYGPQDFTQELTGTTYATINPFGEMDDTSKKNTIFNTYYKMQGYNPITQQYENWHCMGTPLTTPPSGNALLNVSIIATWRDR